MQFLTYNHIDILTAWMPDEWGHMWDVGMIVRPYLLYVYTKSVLKNGIRNMKKLEYQLI